MNFANPFRRSPSIAIHQPERDPSETREQYKARRIASCQQAERETLTGWYTPGGVNSRKERRDALRRNGTMKRYAGSFARGLRNRITQKQNLDALYSRG